MAASFESLSDSYLFTPRLLISVVCGLHRVAREAVGRNQIRAVPLVRCLAWKGPFPGVEIACAVQTVPVTPTGQLRWMGFDVLKGFCILFLVGLSCLAWVCLSLSVVAKRL